MRFLLIGLLVLSALLALVRLLSSPAERPWVAWLMWYALALAGALAFVLGLR